MPDAQRAFLAAGHDDGQRRVEENRGYVLRVALERLDARLRLVVPDADRLRVSGAKRRTLSSEPERRYGLSPAGE